MISTHKFTRHAGTDQSTGAAGTTVKWKGNSMQTERLLQGAKQYCKALNKQLQAARHVSCDNCTLQARDDLALWLHEHEQGRASYVEGFNAVQRALDLLEGAAPEDGGR